jgi:putative PIG3 family NAD(P)H quinone oxidoreductase
MRAVAIDSPGGPEALVLRDIPRPEPGEGEVLIRVAAAGINRADCLQRAGFYDPPPDASPLPGLEVSGIVEAVGAGVSQVKPGDAVAALTHGGGYADYAVAPAGHCLAVPPGLSLQDAAGLPEAMLTVAANLFDGPGKMLSGETLLVQGGSSGIGTMAIQMARARGVTVYVTAGSPEKCAACLSLGASGAVNYRKDDFVKEIKEMTGGAGVDAVLDMVGGETVARNLSLLRAFGRHVSIAFLTGARASISIPEIMQKRLILTGSTLRRRSREEKTRLFEDLRHNFWPLLEKSSIKPVTHAVFPLERASDAHALMESGRHIGKILLNVGGAEQA